MKIIKHKDSVVLIEEEKDLNFIDSSDTNVLISQENVTRAFEHSFQSGPPGQTAYQIALSNGFVGTEEEWIDTLKGSSAYQVALNNGFVGTEEEWLESLKENLNISLSEKGKILTNDGYDKYWINLEDKLNSDTIQWDLGEFS